MPKCSAAVAIVDARPENAELLGHMLSAVGVRPVNAHNHLKRGLLDFVALIAEYKPRAIVWHVGPRYSDNWMYLQLLRESPALAGSRVFVTTSAPSDAAAVSVTEDGKVESVPAEVARVFQAILNHLNGVHGPAN